MYGEDESETLDEYIAKQNNDKPLTPSSSSTFSN